MTKYFNKDDVVTKIYELDLLMLEMVARSKTKEYGKEAHHSAWVMYENFQEHTREYLERLEKLYKQHEHWWKR